ncbi:MAG: PQQ-binding-like beta-propeller repeat protein [Flavobacteriales bacterium]|nr:PQQ-binding-like beta-propeller repeat protein [Flavobacteriales bacterium]
MVRLWIIGIFSIALGGYAQNITKTFPLKWKSKIGVTTYRTNIIEENGFIYVGSNGENTSSDDDALDGVYKIDAKTGKLNHHYQAQILGDNDVTGIALKDGSIYFGTDNYYFYCFDEKSGEEKWKFNTPYDVESVPVVADLDGDSKMEVIFCVQHNGVYCLNTEDGSVKWMLDSISSHQGNVAPLVVDCNHDGVLDVVCGFRGRPNSDKLAGFKMAHYGDYLMALNGKDGMPIWSKPTGAGIHASPFLFEESGELRIASLDSYGEFQVLNLDGEEIKNVGFGYNKYMSPVWYNGWLLLSDYSDYLGDDAFEMQEDGFNKLIKEKSPSYSGSMNGAKSATTLVADILGKGTQQFIAVSESGDLYISDKEGNALKELKFPSGAEATPLIKDVDGDGKLELLIASLDGYLYCYETNSSGEVFYGQFRWSNDNVPNLK